MPEYDTCAHTASVLSLPSSSSKQMCGFSTNGAQNGGWVEEGGGANSCLPNILIAPFSVFLQLASAHTSPKL